MKEWCDTGLVDFSSEAAQALPQVFASQQHSHKCCDWGKVQDLLECDVYGGLWPKGYNDMLVAKDPTVGSKRKAAPPKAPKTDKLSSEEETVWFNLKELVEFLTCTDETICKNKWGMSDLWAAFPFMRCITPLVDQGVHRCSS